MIKHIQIQVLPEQAEDLKSIKKISAKYLEINQSEITHIEILKKSIDARRKIIKINLSIEIFINEKFIKKNENLPILRNVENKETVLIVGAGPAGIFAALKLIENGKKPIIIERGKDVKNRRKDLANINKNHIVNRDSNYCFGEGGAGTYSDGKLYTRSKKRGDVEKILDIFIMHGANPDIKIESQPHIGTNKLPTIIRNIRETIIECGGEFLFNSKLSFQSR